MSYYLHEHHIPIVGDLVWTVRAYSFPSDAESRAEWERLQDEHHGIGDFSCWRTTDPKRKNHVVVVCGRREKLPAVGGEKFAIDGVNAKSFAMRRARSAAEALEQEPTKERHDQVNRYGADTPVVINPETGGVAPYAWPTTDDGSDH